MITEASHRGRPKSSVIMAGFRVLVIGN